MPQRADDTSGKRLRWCFGPLTRHQQRAAARQRQNDHAMNGTLTDTAQRARQPITKWPCQQRHSDDRKERGVPDRAQAEQPKDQRQRQQYPIALAEPGLTRPNDSQHDQSHQNKERIARRPASDAAAAIPTG